MENERPLYKYMKVCTSHGIETVRLYSDRNDAFLHMIGISSEKVFAIMTSDGVYYGTTHRGSLLNPILQAVDRGSYKQSLYRCNHDILGNTRNTQTYYDEAEIELDQNLFMFGGEFSVAGARGDNGGQGGDGIGGGTGGNGGLGFKVICYDKDDNILQETVGYGGGGGGGGGDATVNGNGRHNGGEGGNGSIQRAQIPQGTVRLSLITFGNGQKGSNGTMDFDYNSNSDNYGGWGGNGGASGNGINGSNGSRLTLPYGNSNWTGGTGGNGGSGGTGSNANTGSRYCKLWYYL